MKKHSPMNESKEKLYLPLCKTKNGLATANPDEALKTGAMQVGLSKALKFDSVVNESPRLEAAIAIAISTTPQIQR